jgi:putative endonuclease
MAWYVYIIRNPQGCLYKGSTSDLQKRLRYHNHGLGNWTKGKGPWTLVHFEEFQTKTEAIKKERFYKTGKGRSLLKELLGKSSGCSAVG